MFTDTMDNADPFLARMEEVALRYKGRYVVSSYQPTIPLCCSCRARGCDHMFLFE